MNCTPSTMQHFWFWRTIHQLRRNIRKTPHSSRSLHVVKDRSLTHTSSATLTYHSSVPSGLQRQLCGHSDSTLFHFSRHSSALCSMGSGNRIQSCQSISPVQTLRNFGCAYLHTSNFVNAAYKISTNQRNGYLMLQSSTDQLEIPYIWLRDHCRSQRYYNHDTGQKNADPDLLMKDLTPLNAEMLEDSSSIQITWQDGHVSEFTLDFLVENFYPGHFYTKEKKLWDKNLSAERLQTVSYKDHMTTESGLKQTLSNLVKYGFAVVDKAPASMEGTQQAVERISFILETMFGRMWSFTANAARSDTAYSTLQLAAHTDTTYLTTPAGIQVFQCLEHTGSGGETLLVDGFHAANLLHRTDPAAFEVLRTTVVPHEYKEETRKALQGYHTYSLGTILMTHPASGKLLQLRFNPYDRAPLSTVPPEDIPTFYESYDKLARIIASKDNEFWIKLVPGTILFIDNWRVLHGRAAFDGKRVMCGCYLPQDFWISKAKLLGVL